MRPGCALMVAAVAAYASFEHQRAFALRGGADPTNAMLWPLSVDGLLLATVGLLKPGHRTRRMRVAVWSAFLGCIAVSLAANTAAAPQLAWQPVLVAGWPPVALLLAVELLAHPPHALSAAHRDLPIDHTHSPPPRRAGGCRPTGPGDRFAAARVARSRTPARPAHPASRPAGQRTAHPHPEAAQRAGPSDRPQPAADTAGPTHRSPASAPDAWRPRPLPPAPDPVRCPGRVDQPTRTPGPAYPRRWQTSLRRSSGTPSASAPPLRGPPPERQWMPAPPPHHTVEREPSPPSGRRRCPTATPRPAGPARLAQQTTARHHRDRTAGPNSAPSI